jgi:CubicO group peptidase (beta-lactamase class C family)
MTRRFASLFVAGAALLLSAAGPVTPAALADRFMRDPKLSATQALIVVQDGRTVIERYGRGIRSDTRLVSWSMAKSVTSTLVGQQVGAGRLSLDAPAPVAAWRAKPGDPRAAITLRQLLHMVSGLEHVEVGPGPEDSDTNRMLFGDRAHDAARWAAAKPLRDAPGARYGYSTATSTLLAALVQQVAAPAATPDARKRAMRALMERDLIRPAGMSSLVCEFDAAGTMMGGSLCWATARDWARFGQLYLDGGRVGVRQVVPPAWVDFVRTPSKLDGGYGGQFWLNRPRPPGSDPALFPGQGPADAYAAIGHLGQYVVIVPSKRLVVVRLGRTLDHQLQPVRTALGVLVNSYPDAP